MKYAALQTETSESRGAQEQRAIGPIGPFLEFDEKDDNISIDRRENEPLNLPLTFPQGWDGFVEDHKTSPQPPPYDYVGSLSIISTPMLRDGSLHDEGQMKELLSDLLTDPSKTCRRILGTSCVSSSTGPSSSSSRRPQPSPNHRPVLPARRSTVSTTITPSVPPPAQSSRPTGPVPVLSQPDVPLWTRKRSIRATPYQRDMKGKTAGTIVTRSLSASEAE